MIGILTMNHRTAQRFLLPCILGIGIASCSPSSHESDGVRWFVHAPNLPLSQLRDERDLKPSDIQTLQRSGIVRMTIAKDKHDEFAQLPFTRIHDKSSWGMFIDADSTTPNAERARLQLLVDTGASANPGDGHGIPIMLSARGARKLDAPLLLPMRAYRSLTAGGQALSVWSYLESVRLPNIAMEHVLTEVLVTTKLAPNDDGLLTLDFFRHFSAALFDWDRDRILLSIHDQTQFDFQGWTSVPMVESTGGRVIAIVEASIIGETIPVMLDTGASITSLPDAIIARMNTSPRGRARLTTGSLPITVQSYRAAETILIGGLHFQLNQVNSQQAIDQPRRSTNDSPQTPSISRATLGMDVLTQRPMAIDFQRRLVWFAPDDWPGITR